MVDIYLPSEGGRGVSDESKVIKFFVTTIIWIRPKFSRKGVTSVLFEA